MSSLIRRMLFFLALIGVSFSVVSENAGAWVGNGRPGKLNESMFAIYYTTWGNCKPGSWVYNLDPTTVNYTLNINNRPVRINGLIHGERFQGAAGSVNAADILIEGQNQFRFDFRSGCKDDDGGGEVVVEYFAKQQWNPVIVCKNTFKSGENTINCNLAIKSLNEIDPELYREIENTRAEALEFERRATVAAAARPGIVAEADGVQREIDQILDLTSQLRQIIGSVSNLDFDNLTLEQLTRLIQENPAIGEVYQRLKGQVTQLRVRIEQETVAARNESQQLADNLKQQFQGDDDLQINVDFLDVPIEAAFHANEPHLGPRAPEDRGVHLFQTACDETLARMQAAQNRGNTGEFLALFKGWNDFQNRTTLALQQQRGTAATHHALNLSKERVLVYVRTQVDDYGFFQRARIPDHVKRMIGTLLKDWDEGLSNDLKEELNTWQNELNTTQAQVIETIASLEHVLERVADPRLQNENPDPTLENARDFAQAALKEATENLVRAARGAPDDHTVRDAVEGEERELTSAEEYLAQAQGGMQIALGFADFALGLTPVGSLKDLVEGMIGISVVANPGAQLEMGERAFLVVTGVAGIVTLGGSSGVIKILKGLTQIYKRSKLGTALGDVGRRILRNSEKIVDSAGKFGNTTREFYKEFVEASKHLVGNEIGAIGNGVEDLIKVAGKATRPVANMKEFFTSNFGQVLKNVSERTSKIFQGQKVHIVTENLPEFKHMKKGDLFYLDGLHKDHLEVFTPTGKFKQVLNLDGTVNIEKTAKAIGRSLNVD